VKIRLRYYFILLDASVETFSEAKMYSMIHIGEFYHYSTWDKPLHML